MLLNEILSELIETAKPISMFDDPKPKKEKSSHFKDIEKIHNNIIKLKKLRYRGKKMKEVIPNL